MDDIEPGPIILVSNRGPLRHRREGGERVAERGAGGLVTALSHLIGHLDDATWVCAADTEEDAAVAGESPGGLPLDENRPGVTVRLLTLDAERQRKFYGVIANPLLWFIQHSLWNLPEAPDITAEVTDAFDTGYRPVNEAFAEAVAEEVNARRGRTTVMIHDYHFYLLPALVRERCPDVLVHHFVHIPWPQPDSWRVLPPAMREAVFTGLLGADVIGFHTERYARNFLLGCQELLDLDVDMRHLTIDVGARRISARWYPISVDTGALDELAASPEVRAHEEALAADRRQHLVVRVDRTDPSKNIVRGFRAFDLLLRNHPELAGRVTFLAFLQPSRQEVPQYAAYTEAIREAAEAVNRAHGTAGWQPVDLRLGEDLALAVAAYKSFDVLFVNGIFDGMNLVAKEAVVVNERDGVLALSEHTGAFAELGAFALTLHPFDLVQQAEALYEGLTMDRAERRARQRACAEIVRANDVVKWLRRQLRDLAGLEAAEDPAAMALGAGITPPAQDPAPPP